MRSYLVALLLLFPAMVRGQDALSEARQKLEDLNFPGALEASERALESAQSGPAELAEAYSIKGLSLSALDRKKESLEAFLKLLSIDSEFQISADISPKLSAPFQQALVKSRDFVPISLVHSPAGPRKNPQLKELSVNLASDPHSLVKQLRACYRTGLGPWSRTPPVEVGEPGSFSLPLPAGAPSKDVQYYFEALTAAGGVLARAGDRDKPFGAKPEIVAKAPGPETIPPGAGGGLEDEHHRNGGPKWYQTWWFWTAVGAVVVGASVGIAVGVSSGGNGSGPKDYVINVP
jgi:tetratricopeptide (TPR) repeat protein